MFVYTFRTNGITDSCPKNVYKFRTPRLRPKGGNGPADVKTINKTGG